MTTHDARSGMVGSLADWAPRFDRRYLPVIGTVVVLVVMLVVGGLRYDNFLSPLNLSNLLINNAHLVLLAVGMTFVILTGGIDLSVGAMVALSSVFTANMLANEWSVGLVLPMAIAIGAVIGLAVGIMVFVFEIQPFIATLASMFFARGLSFVISLDSIPITDATIVSMSGLRWGLPGGFTLTPSGLIALASVALAFWALHFTRFGRTVYALGSGDDSARLMGLAVGRVQIAVYVVSGVCASVGGIVFAVYSRSGYSLTGVGMELDAIAAVVIGGTLLTGGSGFVIGSLLGVFVLGLIQTMITFEGTLSSWWTRIAIGVLLFVFVSLQRVLTATGRTST